MQTTLKADNGRGDYYDINPNFSKGTGLGFKTVAVAMVFVLCLMACAGSKINQENFEKIKTGMTLAEVRAILGEPTESSSIDVTVFSGATATWKSKDITINIQFVNGKVIAKEFLKPGKEAQKPGK